jgi:small subunit ribosomal protein S20
MANIKANIKTIRKDKKRHSRNKSYISSLKTTVKKVRNSNSKEDLIALYKKADSLASKGKISKNKASRIKSRLAKKINTNV